MKIIPYDEKYNSKINEFICNILINEFDFECFKEEILAENNKRFIENGGNFWLAVDDADNIIGTICLDIKENNIGELKKLYVQKQYRSKGLAHKLYDELIKFARDNKISKITLGTYNKLEAAVKFYIKKGFEQIKNDSEEKDAIYFMLNEV